MDKNVSIDFLRINTLAVTGGQTGQLLSFTGNTMTPVATGPLGTVLTSGGPGNPPSYLVPGTSDPLTINQLNVNNIAQNTGPIQLLNRLDNRFNSSNTLYGYDAGIAAGAGNGQTCFGYSAGKNILGAIGNTCIGFNVQSGGGVSGAGNTVVGYDCLNNSAGTFNTIIGYQAGKNVGNQSFNLLMGLRAGRDINGSSNFAFGTDTLILATGAGNIGIGNNTATVGVNINNTVLLGHNIVASGVTDSVSIGSATNCNSNSGVLIGATSTLTATSFNSTVVGFNSSCTGGGFGVIVGSLSSATNSSCIGIGGGITVGGLEAIAIGGNTINNGNWAVAVGPAITTAGTESVSIGYNIVGTGNYSVQLGGTYNSGNNAVMGFRSQQVSSEAWIGGGLSGASIDNSGNIIRTPSDERMKVNIQDLDEKIIEGLKKIQVRTFEFNEKYRYISDKTEMGVIAQEVQELFPNLIFKGIDGYMGVNYQGFIPILLAAVKFLLNKI
jgi:hypothetical protein